MAYRGPVGSIQDQLCRMDKETFLLADGTLCKAFRDYLCSAGVWIPRDKKSIPEELAKQVERLSYKEWTDEEFNKQQRYGFTEPFKRWVRHMMRDKNEDQLDDEKKEPLRPSNSNPTMNTGNTYGSRRETQAPSPILAETNTRNDYYDFDTHTRERGGYRATNENDRGDVTPPKLLTDLSKMYNNEKKYGGELYDFLKFKLRIFYDLCRKVGLHTPKHYADDFSTMLKGEAEKYYYAKLCDDGIKDNSHSMCTMMQMHFETEENRQLYTREWRTTDLPTIIRKNPDKNKLECVQILVHELQKIQPGLALDSQTEGSLRTQLIDAVRDVEEAQFCVMKPAATFEGVCADLRSAVGTTLRIQQARLGPIGQFPQSDYAKPLQQSLRSPQQYAQDYDEDDDGYGDGQYWVDRKFNKPEQQHSRQSGRYGGGGTRDEVHTEAIHTKATDLAGTKVKAIMHTARHATAAGEKDAGHTAIHQKNENKPSTDSRDLSKRRGAGNLLVLIFSHFLWDMKEIMKEKRSINFLRA